MTTSVTEGTRTRDDEVLLRDLRAGREDAYAELVDAYGPRLFAVARRLMATDDDAHDAVQDGLLQAFRAIDAFQGASALSTWMHRIVVNAALMRLRARRSRPELALDDVVPGAVEDACPWGAPRAETSEDALIRKELRCRVLMGIAKLPESYRTVLVLRDIEERSTAQTARALGITSNAVKTRLHRARRALRTILEPEMIAHAA